MELLHGDSMKSVLKKKDKDDDFIKKDCRERISKLEALLVQSAKEKDELRKMVLDMTGQIAELRVRVEFLTTENAKLQPKPKTTTTKKNLLKG